MYYPYLRGRQFELIAIREYSKIKGSENNVIPIIEPVRKTFRSMELALGILIENDVKFALILNPKVGDIKNKPSKILSELDSFLKDSSKWIPAFILNNDFERIAKNIEEHKLNNIMLICSDQTDSNDAEFNGLVEMEQVQYLVSEENRSLKRHLLKIGKDFIRLDDNFKGKKRNSDYLEAKEEKFTEEHYYYSQDSYQGFADFGPLVSSYSVGGSAPYAISIHLTYLKTQEEIWIRHFTSESNSDQANIQGKFAEAAKKACRFLDEKDIQTVASNELRKYFHEAKYPGLGMVKKITIKHHLELINESI